MIVNFQKHIKIKSNSRNDMYLLSMIWHWVNNLFLIREMVCQIISSTQKLNWERMHAELGKSTQVLYNSNEIVSLLY